MTCLTVCRGNADAVKVLLSKCDVSAVGVEYIYKQLIIPNVIRIKWAPVHYAAKHKKFGLKSLNYFWMLTVKFPRHFMEY
jgi:hypothetical protein